MYVIQGEQRFIVEGSKQQDLSKQFYDKYSNRLLVGTHDLDRFRDQLHADVRAYNSSDKPRNVILCVYEEPAPPRCWLKNLVSQFVLRYFMGEGNSPVICVLNILAVDGYMFSHTIEEGHDYNLEKWSAKLSEEDMATLFNMKQEATFVPESIDDVIHALVRAQHMGDLDIDAARTVALIDVLYTVRERYEDLYDFDIEYQEGGDQ